MTDTEAYARLRAYGKTLDRIEAAIVKVDKRIKECVDLYNELLKMYSDIGNEIETLAKQYMKEEDIRMALQIAESKIGANPKGKKS